MQKKLILSPPPLYRQSGNRPILWSTEIPHPSPMIICCSIVPAHVPYYCKALCNPCISFLGIMLPPPRESWSSPFLLSLGIILSHFRANHALPFIGWWASSLPWNPAPPPPWQSCIFFSLFPHPLDFPLLFSRPQTSLSLATDEFLF